MTKRTLLVDDHIMFREGLSHLLEIDPTIQIVGYAGTAEEAVFMASKLHPDLILMDYSLPDQSGLDATRAIIEERPETLVVFLTVFDSDEILFAALRSGAKGYLLKSMSSTELLAALHAIEKSESAISRVMTKRIIDEFSRLEPAPITGQSKLANLTVREFEILKELSYGAKNHDIARHFALSESTVKNQVHSILSKLGLKNRHEVIWFAYQHGIANLFNSKGSHDVDGSH